MSLSHLIHAIQWKSYQGLTCKLFTNLSNVLENFLKPSTSLYFRLIENTCTTQRLNMKSIFGLFLHIPNGNACSMVVCVTDMQNAPGLL